MLTCLRPHGLCWTFVLGVARLSPWPTSLFVVVALCIGGGDLLFPYLWSPCSRSTFTFLSSLFSSLFSSLVSSRHPSSALLRPNTPCGSVNRTIYNSRITINGIAGPLPPRRVEVGLVSFHLLQMVVGRPHPNSECLSPRENLVLKCLVDFLYVGRW